MKRKRKVKHAHPERKKAARNYRVTKIERENQARRGRMARAMLARTKKTAFLTGELDTGECTFGIR